MLRCARLVENPIFEGRSVAACSPAGAYQVQREAHEVTQAMRLRVGSCTRGLDVRKVHDTCRGTLPIRAAHSKAEHSTAEQKEGHRRLSEFRRKHDLFVLI
jgi:hypothetical protein